jgi:hypothetical protein
MAGAIFYKGQGYTIGGSSAGGGGSGGITDVTVDGISVVVGSVAQINLTGKQDKLIAGSNITIGADGKTISAQDTTYSDFAGSAHGLVPSVASQSGKFLRDDGAWAEAGGGGGGGASVSLLTKAQYNALTPAQKTNGTIYFVYSTADPNYEYKVCKDGQIIAQRNKTTGDVTWWFIGYSNGGNDWQFPQDMQNYNWMPQSNLILGVSYDSDKVTQNANIGVYNGYAREWSIDLASLVGYTTWGVVTNSGGTGQNNPWSEPPDTDTANSIYYMGYKFSAYDIGGAS